MESIPDDGFGVGATRIFYTLLVTGAENRGGRPVRLTDGRFYQQACAGLHREPTDKGTLSIEKGLIATAAKGIARPLGGRVCLPGLTDAHLHIFPLALFRLQLDIATAGVRSIDTLLEALEQISPERRFGG